MTLHSKRKLSENKTKSSRERRNSIRSYSIINIFLLCVFVIGAVCYLSQIAQSTTYGYMLNKLQNEKSDRNKELQAQEQYVNSLASVDVIAESAKGMNMVPNGNVEYLEEASTGVALR